MPSCYEDGVRSGEKLVWHPASREAQEILAAAVGRAGGLSDSKVCPCNRQRGYLGPQGPYFLIRFFQIIKFLRTVYYVLGPLQGSRVPIFRAEQPRVAQEVKP